jgi:hypothetical protein
MINLIIKNDYFVPFNESSLAELKKPLSEVFWL